MKGARGNRLPPYLSDAQAHIEELARSLGLDFFTTIYEMVGYDQMTEIASYGGFPVRYPHWRFGMDYERMAKSTEYGLSKIYELVINNNPAVAYLLEGNSLVEQKLVMAHVSGHVDFFKNNFAFQTTNQGIDPRTGESIRKWIDTMANHGAIMRKWINRVGIEEVEQFLDHCLSLENLIDPENAYGITGASLENPEGRSSEPELLKVDKAYMAPFINPEEFVDSQRKKAKAEKERERKLPEKPERDVLGFLIEHAPLEPWEHDILTIVRREAYYFWPQMQTKIMNEGWASYWHSHMMTRHLCDASEIVDYADRNASVLSTAGRQLNPYKLGVELYRHIEERWNRGQFGREWDDCDNLDERQAWNRELGQGREKIFQVRGIYNDLTFIDAFLTPEFVRDQKLFAFGYNPRQGRMEVESRTFDKVKKQLLFQLTNAGNPFIRVVDSNLSNRGELQLVHEHQGVGLDQKWAKEVLVALHRLWRRPVQVESIADDKPCALRFDGQEHTNRPL